jgi:hypothetical protein
VPCVTLQRYCGSGIYRARAIACGSGARRTWTSNRCLKSAKQAGSGPAARARNWSSTRSFPYPDCPLLTRTDRCSVPQCAPTIRPAAVGSIADGISNTRSIVCSSGDLARPRPGLADCGAAGAVRGAARRGVGRRPGGSRQGRALPPRGWHRIWSLMQLERQLRPEAFGRRRGGYLDRRRIRH